MKYIRKSDTFDAQIWQPYSMEPKVRTIVIEGRPYGFIQPLIHSEEVGEPTLQGQALIRPGDYVISFASGYVDYVRKEEFEARYEPHFAEPVEVNVEQTLIHIEVHPEPPTPRYYGVSLPQRYLH